MKTLIKHSFPSGGCLVLALLLIQASRLPAADKFTLDTARAAAAKGDPKAECYLAMDYANGKNVPRDYGQAAEYLRQAADQGYAPAQNNLGVFYMRGLGVKQDAAEAIKWFRKAAGQGDPAAEYSLGLCYFQGHGVPTNVQESLSWYRKAAGQNQSDAIGALADIYLTKTKGVKIDYAEAFKWCQKGAVLGNADCLNDLGFLYENGFGVAQNADLALKYYREAAGKGFVRAYANLGQMYQIGNGLKADPVEAYKWYLLGIRRGDPLALDYKEQMDAHNALSDAERAEANQRVNEYLTQPKTVQKPPQAASK